VAPHPLSDALTQQIDAACIRLQKTQRKLERRAFAGAVGPQQTEALTWRHLEGDAIDCTV
jgi:hypothetical protein